LNVVDLQAQTGFTAAQIREVREHEKKKNKNRETTGSSTAS